MGFVTQLGAILERYPDEVVEYVTDPMTGIQRKVKFPPSIAEVVEACDERVAVVERHKRYLALPPSQPRLASDVPSRPRHRANIRVPHDAPQYQRMVEKANAPGADPLDFRWEGSDLWVSLYWITSGR